MNTEDERAKTERKECEAKELMANEMMADYKLHPSMYERLMQANTPEEMEVLAGESRTIARRGKAVDFRLTAEAENLIFRSSPLDVHTLPQVLLTFIQHSVRSEHGIPVGQPTFPSAKLMLTEAGEPDGYLLRVWVPEEDG